MVFEQAYGQWIVSELNAHMQKINKKFVCKLYDEVGYKPLYNEPDAIAVVISGGNASRSAVKGQDQNVLPLTVTVICKEQYSSFARNAINSVQEKWNSVPTVLSYYDSVGKEEAETNAKSIFTTPFVFNESDYATKYETIKAAFISFSASVIYGQTAVIEPEETFLLVNKKAYQINHIAECNSAAVPSYESYLPQGAERLGQCCLSRVNSFSYTLYKVAGDELQALFDSELNCGDGLYGKRLVLRTGGADISIKTYQLNSQYVNNAAAYNLILGV